MSSSYTAGGRVPEPFVHYDNRGLLLSCGGRCVAFLGDGQLMWAAETLEIIAEDGRGTRSQPGRVLGGFRVSDRGDVVLSGAERGVLVSLELGGDAFEALRRTQGESQPRRSAG